MSNSQTKEPTEDSIKNSRSNLVIRLTEFTTELNNSVLKDNKVDEISIETLTKFLDTITTIKKDLINLRTDIGRFFLKDLKKFITDKLRNNNQRKGTVYSDKALVMALTSFNKSITEYVSNKNVSEGGVYIGKVKDFEQFISAYQVIIENFANDESFLRFKNNINASKNTANQINSQAKKATGILARGMQVLKRSRSQNTIKNNVFEKQLEEKQGLIQQIKTTVRETAELANTGAGGPINGADAANMLSKLNNTVQKETASKIQSIISKLSTRKTQLTKNQTNRFNEIVNKINGNLIRTFKNAMFANKLTELRDSNTQNFLRGVKSINKSKEKINAATQELNTFVGSIVGEPSATAAARVSNPPE